MNTTTIFCNILPRFVKIKHNGNGGLGQLNIGVIHGKI